MKKILLVLLCLPVLILAQQTYVPDNNFEFYLENNGMGNGVANDDYVTTANIDTVTSLNVSFQNIADLTGIEDFTALTNLSCFSNQLTTLDVSNNLSLWRLWCWSNQLTTLDLSTNTALTYLSCFSNQLTTLDVSNNTALYAPQCNNNQLTYLDIWNTNLSIICIGCSYVNGCGFCSTNNPQLFCVLVDNIVYADTNWTERDSWTVFSTNSQI